MCVLARDGILGIDVILGALLVSQDVAGWIVGLIIGLASVILAALLRTMAQFGPGARGLYDRYDA